MNRDKSKKTVFLGPLGIHAHVVGNKIMAHAVESEGFKVVNIGTFCSKKISSMELLDQWLTPS